MSSTDGAIDWRKLEELFHGALELDPIERSRYLERSCGDDAALRSEVESLIAFSGGTMESLKVPVESVAQSLAWRQTGQEIGPYRLTRLLGDGGQVYLAERSDHLYDQQVAIKLMHAGLKQAGAMLLRFSAERQILANLNHPNIARLLDAGITNDGVPYLVMEYIDGLHIDQYCRTNGLSAHAILELFLAVCSAVEYAHKSLVIHRDLKPANIVVNAEGVPKLLDFGIAKLLDVDAGDALTRVTERIMTPEYASPEQVRGEPVTTATDVYALGVLLFELLSGERPFRMDQKSPLEIIQVICEQQPQPPSSVAAAREFAEGRSRDGRLNRDLDNIVLMAMRKESSRRYAGVSVFAADIHAYLEGYPVQARTDRWSYRSQKFVLRHKAGVTAAVLVGLALVGFSIGMGVLADRANRARLTAERETQFLNTIFQAATPDQAKGKPVMARDLLDQGTKRIDSELAGQPDLQATMLDNVGRAYRAIGLYSQASSLLDRAFQIRRRLFGRDSLEAASTEDALATALRLQGQFAQADPYFRDALAVRERHVGMNNNVVAESMTNLGECLYWEDRAPEAESTLRQALAINRGLAEDAGGSVRNYLALAIEREGKFPEAAQLLREAVEITRKSKGPESSDYMVSLHNYAGAMIDSGDLDAAESTERQVLALREAVFGRDHPDVFYPLNNLGFILLEKGAWKQAIPILDRTVELSRKVGIGQQLATALANRARARQQGGDYAGAERDLSEAGELAGDGAAQASWTSAKITAVRGSLAFERGNYKAAADFAHRAMDMQRGLGGDETPAYAASLVNLGDALLFEPDLVDAEAAYRQALLIRRKRFNPGNPVTTVAQTRLSETLLREGKTGEAEPLLQQAFAAARNEPFPRPAWETAEIDFALGACLRARGQTAEGDKLLQTSEYSLRDHPQRPFRWPAIARGIIAEDRQSSTNRRAMALH